MPGLKRKLQTDEMGSLINIFPDSTNLNPVTSIKRSRSWSYKPANCEHNVPGNGNISADDSMEMSRHNPPLNASKSPCAVEG